MASVTPLRISLPSTLALRSLISKSANSSSAPLDFISAVVRRISHPRGPADRCAQQPFVHLLLVHAGQPGTGGDVLDGAVAVTDREPTLRQLDHLGHVTVLGGELGQLATEHGHMAEVVELAEGGLAIRHCNCPIQDVAARTGLPCVNEQQMYERLLGTPVSRTTWMADAANDCTYEVKRSGGRVG